MNICTCEEKQKQSEEKIGRIFILGTHTNAQKINQKNKRVER
jgi:hypothetical protein